MTKQSESFKEWRDRTGPATPSGLWGGQVRLLVLALLTLAIFWAGDDPADTVLGVMLLVLTLECVARLSTLRRGEAEGTDRLIVLRALCLLTLLALVAAWTMVAENRWLGLAFLVAVVVGDLTDSPSFLRWLSRRRHADGP